MIYMPHLFSAALSHSSLTDDMSASSRWMTNSISLSLSFRTSSLSSRSRVSSQASWWQSQKTRMILSPSSDGKNTTWSRKSQYYLFLYTASFPELLFQFQLHLQVLQLCLDERESNIVKGRDGGRGWQRLESWPLFNSQYGKPHSLHWSLGTELAILKEHEQAHLG